MKTPKPTQQIIGIALLLALLAPTITKAQSKNIFSDKGWIPFSWESMKLGNRTFDKAAIIVPFKIDGIDADFTLQFDLGATSSMLYGNSINYFLNGDNALKAKLDTTNKRFMIQGTKSGGFRNLDARLGSIKYIFDDMAYFKGFGDTLTIDSIKKGKPIRIGTLGAPFFKDKVLIIDYPNQRILILDSLNEKSKGDFDFVDARFDLGTLKIPFTIDGTPYWLMFDTGSSIFAIMTDQQHYNTFTGNTQVDSLGISSWGQTKMVYGKQINKSVKLGNAKLPNNYVYMMPGNDWDDFYRQEKIIGITGNAYFLNNVVAIDFKHLKFGVYKHKVTTRSK
jgi:hypothetical protein